MSNPNENAKSKKSTVKVGAHSARHNPVVGSSQQTTTVETEVPYNPLLVALQQEREDKKIAQEIEKQYEEFNPLKVALEQEKTGKPKRKFFAKSPTKKPKKPVQQAPKKTKRPKRHKINWLNVIIVIFLLAGIAGGAGAYVFVTNALENSVRFDPTKVVTKNSTQLFDRHGEMYANNIGLETRRNVTYEELPQCVIDAFVAIEDSRFFVHNGFDLPRFIRAAIENVRTMSFDQGGSTFTMQMIKNSYFMIEGTGGAAKSIERKIQEIAMAMEADEVLSKEDILTYYINRINFGANNGRGIQVSSQYFFNKDVRDIGLSEAAMLAGIVNAPYGYNPFWNLEKATWRRNEVLNMMEAHGYITAFECQAAKKIKVEDLLVRDEVKVKYDTIPNQAFIDCAIDEVMAITGEDPYDVPMRIYTTLDRGLQKVVEDVQNGQYPAAKVNAHQYLDNAVIVLDHNAEILAVGGGKNYNIQRGFNFAVNMKKQPGSVTKPILSYPLAFEYLGLTTESYVYDGPMNFPGTSTRVVDYNNRYRGIISVHQAISDSRNVPAIDELGQVIRKVGRETVVDYLNAIGFSYVDIDNFSVMNGIGGGGFLTNPVQMAGAYNMLMNLGEYRKPHAIRRIEFDDGRQAIDVDYPATRVISDAAAWLVTDVVRKNVGTGPAKNTQYGLLRRNYPVYGKSGTTDWGSKASRKLKLPVTNGAKDKMMMIATSQYTIAVWVGFDSGVPGKNTYYAPAMVKMRIPSNIARPIMDYMEKHYPRPAALPRPKSVGSVTFIKGYAFQGQTVHYMPYPGIASSQLVNGLNKAGTTELTPFEPPNLGDIFIVSAAVTHSNATSTTISVTVPTFYLPELLEIAPKTKRFYLGKNSWVGGRGNDVTWWMGPVRYYAQVENMSSTMLAPAEVSAENTIEVTFDTGSYSGNQVKVCAYYAYSYMPNVRSGYACQPVMVP